VLWALTTFFNPNGYERRLENYRAFRERLAVPLLALEASHRGVFQLGEDDADALVQVTCPDILWQKERLLNVGLRALPAECTQVAWLDCDIVFSRNDWAGLASLELESTPLVHLCDEVRHLVPDAQLTNLADAEFEGRLRSVAAAWQEGAVPPGMLHANTFTGPGFCTGYAWAAQRAMLEQVGFYDACIVGGGDKAMFAAAIGRPDEVIEYPAARPVARPGG